MLSFIVIYNKYIVDTAKSIFARGIVVAFVDEFNVVIIIEFKLVIGFTTIYYS